MRGHRFDCWLNPPSGLEAGQPTNREDADE